MRRFHFQALEEAARLLKFASFQHRQPGFAVGAIHSPSTRQRYLGKLRQLPIHLDLVSLGRCPVARCIPKSMWLTFRT